MKNAILGLRSFSLRVAILLMFVAAFISGLCLLFCGTSLVFTSLCVSLLASAFLFVVFAVSAIPKDKKAYTTSCFILLAFAVSLWGILPFVNGVPVRDYEWLEIRNLYILGRTHETTLWANLIDIFAFVYAFKYVSSRYRFCWIMAIASNAWSVINLFLFASGVINYELYSGAMSIVSSVFGGVLLIALLIIGNRTLQKNSSKPDTIKVTY